METKTQVIFKGIWVAVAAIILAGLVVFFAVNNFDKQQPQIVLDYFDTAKIDSIKRMATEETLLIVYGDILERDEMIKSLRDENSALRARAVAKKNDFEESKDSNDSLKNCVEAVGACYEWAFSQEELIDTLEKQVASQAFADSLNRSIITNLDTSLRNCNQILRTWQEPKSKPKKPKIAVVVGGGVGYGTKGFDAQVGVYVGFPVWSW